MAIEERLKSIPRSYNDFVKYVIARIEEDENVEKVVLQQLETHPESNSSDVLKAIYNYLDIGEPLEIIDDDEGYRQVV